MRGAGREQSMLVARGQTQIWYNWCSPCFLGRLAKVFACSGVLSIAGNGAGRLEWNKMPMTLDLPRPLDEEITLEAKREGVPAADHATLLLYLASSLLRGEEPTPFQKAVKDFLSYHSLDADRV